MGDDNAAFEKILNVVERYVEAWSKAYSKIDELSKSIDILTQEIKDLNNLSRQKPCIINTKQYAQLEVEILSKCKDIGDKLKQLIKSQEEFEKNNDHTVTVEKQTTYWIKLATGFVVLLGAIITIIVAIMSK